MIRQRAVIAVLCRSVSWPSPRRRRPLAQSFYSGLFRMTRAGPADPARARRQAAADLQLKGRSRKFYSRQTERHSKGRLTQRTAKTNRTRLLRNNTRNGSVLLAAAQVSLPVPLSQGASSPACCEASRFAVAPFIDANQRNGAEVMQRSERDRARLAGLCSVLAVTGLESRQHARAEQPPHRATRIQLLTPTKLRSAAAGMSSIYLGH